VTSPVSDWRYHIRIDASGREAQKITDEIKRTSGVNVGPRCFSFPTAADRDRVLGQIPEDG
jgi:hypothetical protein